MREGHPLPINLLTTQMHRVQLKHPNPLEFGGCGAAGSMSPSSGILLAAGMQRSRVVVPHLRRSARSPRRHGLLHHKLLRPAHQFQRGSQPSSSTAFKGHLTCRNSLFLALTALS